MSLQIYADRHSAIVTHGDCPDGSSGIILAKKLISNIHVTYGVHKTINSQVEGAVNLVGEKGVLFITDISCDENVLVNVCEKLKSKGASLCIYEHHETRSWLRNFVLPQGLSGEIVFDQGRCGSKIMFDCLVKEHAVLQDYEDFISVINDRDLWLNKDVRGLSLAKLHQIYGDAQFVQRFSQNPSVVFTSEENVLLNYVYSQEKRRIQNALQRMEIKKDPQGFVYGVVCDTGDSSDLLNAAIEKFNLEYAIMLDLNKGKGSLRGRGNMDCSRFAENLGGGGHKCASGFPIAFERPVF